MAVPTSRGGAPCLLTSRVHQPWQEVGEAEGPAQPSAKARLTRILSQQALSGRPSSQTFGGRWYLEGSK